MTRQLLRKRTSIMAVALLTLASPAGAISLLPGFNSNSLPANDDASTGLVAIGFDVNFFGPTASSLYVNNNGNLTFGAPLRTFTPFGLTGNTGIPIIAPFFADVDTRNPGSALTQFGTGTIDGKAAFGATWDGVGYFSQATDKLNAFQVLLIDRSDIGAGDFDIEFRYDQIEWETGDASGGSNGLGGSSARVGYSAGSGEAGSFAELTGSGVNGAFIDGGINSLVANSNIGEAGRYLFNVRNGVVVVPPPTTNPVPEPGAALIFGSALLLVRGARRKRA